MSSYSLDGGPAKIFNATEVSQFQFSQKFYQSGTLKPGVHSLVVTHISSNSGIKDPPFHIDYFHIFTPDSPLPSVQPSSASPIASTTGSSIGSTIRSSIGSPTGSSSGSATARENGGKSRSGDIPIPALVGDRNTNMGKSPLVPRPYTNLPYDDDPGSASGLSRFSLPLFTLPRRMIPPSKEGRVAQYSATSNLIGPPQYEE
ncbi:hypothetical protein GALMADRAFT_136307 [Galerina marginata CBS 339.88]|uniref:Uncharacterized protein n=1 Tax=Galerina marginata (strain CBS 339.88) TaxID=685588 RepID=A0A067TG01_GALM3|nr:hypothetical protein GALMADRAFT_136307 [Galerina marginata CBS 339.88]